jgi:hypothetical protein
MRSYGGEIVLVDVAAGGLLLGGVLGRSPPVALTGGAAYLAAGPTVHAFHGESDNAFASLGLRLLDTAGAAAVGVAVGGGGVGSTILGPLFALLATPVVTAIDASSIAYEPAPPVEVVLTRFEDGGVVGLSGSF